jgi:uncharacterized protein YjbI with pentapeptide repeats
MADDEALRLLKQRPTVWNDERKLGHFSRVDLSDSDLSGASLAGADLWDVKLSAANLVGADLRGVDLSMANLVAADLRGADLKTANLNGAVLIGTKLGSANLVGADLAGANFSGADLSDTDLSGANLWNTIFADTNLGVAKGLETCNHYGPSTVGIDTLFESNGEIPEGFLRGCGVPGQFIAYARSLVTKPVQFYSCFISYSSHDQAFAERLHADLRAKNLRCWFAPEDLKIGDRFQDRIEESIYLFDKVMIVLSEASVQSRWVEREVNAAREREDRENRLVLFPIRIDDAVMSAPQAWAADIRRTRHIGDFSTWQSQVTYKAALDRLLRSLRAG